MSKQESTHVFVASIDREDTGFKWLEIMNSEWVTTPWLSQATTYPIESDLRADLAKDDIEEYTIHVVKMNLMD